MMLSPPGRTIVALSEPKSPNGYVQRRHYKLPPDEVKSAMVLLLEGKSLRAVARYYSMNHKVLSRRLRRDYGVEQYSKALRTKGGLSILSGYSKHPNQRLRQAASDWAKQNLDLLIEMDLDAVDAPNLMTDRQVIGSSLYSVPSYYIENSRAFAY